MRSRLARPGEELQLYTGMRTLACKLLLRAPCVNVVPIEIDVSFDQILEVRVVSFLCPYFYKHLDEFARRDGFSDQADMHAFWLKEHGVGTFRGVMISWRS